MTKKIRIGPYEITDLLSKGAFGMVFLAKRGKKVCVVKTLRLSKITDPVSQDMFRKESELLMELEHGNIVSAFDAGEDRGLLYLAMNYVRGSDLAFLNRRLAANAHAWEFADICHIAREILYGIQYAHTWRDLEIVHRDIKPANILVSAEGEILITDFGVSSALPFASSANSVKGTLRYMAPEQFTARATPKSDLFGLGAVLHEMIEGKRFRGELRARA